MAMERISVSDYEIWGKLIKTWATGIDRINNGKNYLPPPATIADLKQQCAWAGMVITIPARYEANPVRFAQADENTVLIRLPPAVLIKDSEDVLKQPGGNYPIPGFYKTIFQNVNPIIADADKLKVHAERIGDYSMAACM